MKPNEPFSAIGAEENTMFSIIVGVVEIFIAISFILLASGKAINWWAISILLVGVTFLILGTRDFASPHFNKSQQPLRLKNSDTLYVAPKNGFQGAAVIVGRDSTGHETIIVRNFVAQHTIAAAIK